MFLLLFLSVATAVLTTVDQKLVYLTHGVNRVITNSGIIGIDVQTGNISGSASLLSISDGPCVDRPILTGALQVATGTRHACALTTTGVFCWGDNSFCQLMQHPVSLYAVPIITGTFRSVAIFDTVTCVWIGSTNGVCWGALHLNSPECIITPFTDALFGLFRVGYAIVAVGTSRITTVIGATRFTGQRHLFASAPLLLRVVDNALEIVFDDAYIRCSPDKCADAVYEITSQAEPVPPTCVINHREVYCPDTESEMKWYAPVHPLHMGMNENFESDRLASIPGCDQEIFLDGISTGLFTRDNLQQVTVRGQCVRVYGCVDSDRFGVPANIQSIAAGDSHMCMLANGLVWCTGSSDSCQFIRNGSPNAADGWEQAFTPWPVEMLAAGGNLTCVSNKRRVFCTGCSITGCMCTNGTSLTMASDVLRITVTRGGFCVLTQSDPLYCAGEHGGMVPDQQCHTNGTSTTCGHIAFATPLPHILVANNMHVAILTQTTLCVSRNRLRNINCSGNSF